MVVNRQVIGGHLWSVKGHPIDMGSKTIVKQFLEGQHKEKFGGIRLTTYDRENYHLYHHFAWLENYSQNN